MKKIGFLAIPLVLSLLTGCKVETVTITWQNYDGTILEIDENVPIGTIPSYDKETPTKPSDTQYSYIFSGWSPEISKAKVNQTYVANYSKDAIEYEVKFVDKEGDCDTKIITADSLTITSPDHSTTEHYENGHWEDESGLKLNPSVTHTFTKDELADYTFTWIETAHEYEVKFVDKEGDCDTKIITADSLTITSPDHSATEHYDGYWKDESGLKLNPSVTYTFTKDKLANYTFTWIETVHEYKVKFVDNTGIVKSSIISLDKLDISSPSHSTTKYYENGHWEDESGLKLNPSVTHTFTEDELADYTFTWIETAKVYTVTFNYNDGTKETKNISVVSLKLTAPKTKATPQPENRFVWVTNGIVMESEESKVLKAEQLGNYTFTETETIKYKITYHLDGGVDPGNPSLYDVSQKIILKEPTQNNFLFSGWYLDEAKIHSLHGNGWDPSAKTGDIDLYADWHSEKDLNDYTWKEISDISKDGRPDKYFDIGQTKTVMVNNAEFNVRIIDFKHDVDTSGIPIGITFEFTNFVSWTEWMPSYSDRNFNYLNSTIKSNTDSIFEKLPSDPVNLDLKEVIKSTNKKVATSSDKGKNWKITTFATKLFPLSIGEYGISPSKSKASEEGTTYTYYLEDSVTRRKKNNPYWVRSPISINGSSGDYGYTIQNNGLDGSSMIHLSRGLIPAFCV